MRITRSTLRRLIAEESARLLREAAEEEITTTNEAERGKKGKGRDNNCLYITYGGRGVYYFVAKGGLDEREAVERGRDVTAELVGDEDVADPLSLYDWLQNHDQVEYVFDDESIGGFAEKHEFMEQLRGVGEEEGLFADDEFVNEAGEDPNYFSDEFEDSSEDPNYFDTDYDEEDDYYGDDDPFGDDEAIEKGYEYVPGVGYKKPGDDSWMDIETGDDDIPYGAADVAGRMGRGHRTDESAAAPSPLEAAERRLRAAIKAIRPDKVSSLTKRVLDLIDEVMMEEAIAAEADGSTAFPFNASVKVLEQMGDTFPEDADFEPLHAAIDAVIKPQWAGALQNAAEAEADRRDVEDTERDLSHPSRFLEEGDGAAPRARLKAYLKSKHANIAAVMKAIDDVIEYYNSNYEEEDLDAPTSEDVTFKLSDAVLRYIPQKDADLWHSMIDDVLADEFSAADAAYDAAYRKDIEDTERDLSHPSRFLEARDPLDSSDYEGSRAHRAYSDDPDDESGKVDRWGEPIPYLKHDSEATDLDPAAEDEMAGEEEDWSWDGYDYEPDLKRTSHYAHTAQKYKETGNSDPGMDPDDHRFGRARGLDESDYDDYEHAYAMGGGSDEEGFAIDYDTGRPSPFAAKHLPKPRPAQDDIEGPDQDDVWGDDDMGRKGAMDDYEHAWKMGGGRDEEGFAADYDTGKKRQFPPARGGLSEARWAKLAGILKG